MLIVAVPHPLMRGLFVRPYLRFRSHAELAISQRPGSMAMLHPLSNSAADYVHTAQKVTWKAAVLKGRSSCQMF